MLCYNEHMPDRLHADLLLLKLGGSLITDKTTPRTARLGLITRLAQEIKAAKIVHRELKIVLGHGSGSFGHVPAKRYGTRQGVDSDQGWRGFAEVWYEAAALNRIVMDALQDVGLPAIAFPPSAAVTARDGKVLDWNLLPLVSALEAGLQPVIFGDVVFDQKRGGTILSTEDLFTYLAQHLLPRRILLAGIDPGVWQDFPACTQLVPEINPGNWEGIASALGDSASTDVTGGMRAKVGVMLDLVQEIPGLEVIIFGGQQSGNLSAALNGERIGTRLTSEC
jgi:isopentenyl phosphate kinase